MVRTQQANMANMGYTASDSCRAMSSHFSRNNFPVVMLGPSDATPHAATALTLLVA